MRAAPPVDVALDGGRLERMLITVLHGVAGAMLAAWLSLHAEWRPGGPAVLAGLLAAAALMAALGHALARRVLPPQPGRLRWDGQTWSCVGGRQIPLQRLVLALDLGLWVLLRLHPADGHAALWRVASAHGAQGAWHGLRVALAAHAGTPGQAGAAP